MKPFNMHLNKIFAAGSLAAALLFCDAAVAAPGNLDELLEQTKSARLREEKINQEREAKFLADHNKQAALLAEAKAALTEQRTRTQQLTATFDGNEKKLAELQHQLEARAGNLGEMF